MPNDSNTEHAEAAQTAPEKYDGAGGYFYGGDWYSDLDGALEAWWEGNWSSTTGSVTKAELLASAVDAFCAGVRIVSKPEDAAERVLQELEENAYSGCENYKDDWDLPRSGPKWDALVAAIAAMNDELTPTFLEGKLVDVTAEAAEWIEKYFEPDEADPTVST